MTRKICIFTGTRAEYGLFYWIMKKIQDAPDMDLQIIVSGAHLSERLGATWREIEKDGFTISRKVPMDLKDDSPLAICKAMGEELIGVSQALNELKPDILLLLGDRYESFIAASAAMMLRIPIGHIHGGEATEGLIDEAVRHSITKMSHLHFTAAEEYKNRILQLGENKQHVFNVGAPGIDHILHADFMDKNDLSASLDFGLDAPVAMITYHPVTLRDGDPTDGINELLNALDQFPDLKVVFSKANADSTGKAINAVLEKYVSQNPERAILVSSLGQKRYLSLLSLANVVIGNSSSGIIEAPSIGTPTVNIGIRQQGRLRSPSIIDCDENSASICQAIALALSDEYQKISAKKQSPYGQGNASQQIVDILRTVSLEGILIKPFIDQPCES